MNIDITVSEQDDYGAFHPVTLPAPYVAICRAAVRIVLFVLRITRGVVVWCRREQK